MNDFDILERNVFDTRFPNYNKDLFKKMDDKNYDFYLGLYSAYNALLYSFLLKKTSLLKLDKEIADNNKYKIVSREKMDLYQSLAPKELKYLYVRNNLHIERLSDEELDFLNKKLFEFDFDYNEEVDKFISNTIKKVIFEDVDNGNVCKTSFGPPIEIYIIENNVLLFGFRYDDTYEVKDSIKDFVKSNDDFDNACDLCNNITNTIYDELPGYSIACRPYVTQSIKAIPNNK